MPVPFDVAAFALGAWRAIAASASGADVWLDVTAGELARVCGADALLWDKGAVAVREIGAAEGELFPPASKKACVVLTSALDESKSALKSLLSSHPTYASCAIFCAVSEATHALLGAVPVAASAGVYAFYERLAADWMPALRGRSEGESAVSVRHTPLFIAPATPSLFLLPAWHGFFPPPLPPPHADSAGGDHPPLPTAALTHGARSLAGALASLFDALDTREDCFCIGQASSAIGTELARLRGAQATAAQHTHRASVLLFDRTLDLASATSHAENIADRMFAKLSPYREGSCDAAVDYSPLYVDAADRLVAAAYVPAGLCAAAGSVLHGCNARASAAFSQIAGAPKAKDAAAAALHAAVDLASKEGVSLGADIQRMLMGKASAEHVAAVLRAIAANPKIHLAHAATVDVLLASAVALAVAARDRRAERALASEKVFQLSCAEWRLSSSGGRGGAQHPFRQLADLVRTTPDMEPADALALLVHVSSLARADADDAEAGLLRVRLAESITSWFVSASARKEAIEERNVAWLGEKGRAALAALALTDGAEGSGAALSNVVEDRLQALMDALANIAADRARLHRFGELYPQGAAASGGPFQPLLAQLVDAVLDDRRPELSDLVHKSVGLKGLLKSGFGRFLSSVKPRPDNHPLLVIVAVGGVTFEEARHVADIVRARHSDVQIVIGATAISTPEATLAQLFDHAS